MKICKKCGKQTDDGETIFGIYWCKDCNYGTIDKIEKTAKHKKHIEGEY